MELSKRQFIETTVYRNNSLSKQQFIETSVYRNDSLSKRQFIETTVYRNDSLSKRQFIETTVYRNDSLLNFLKPNTSILNGHMQGIHWILLYPTKAFQINLCNTFIEFY